MSTSQLIPVISPDGQPGHVAQNELEAATKAGYRPGVHVTSPDGATKGIVAQDEFKAASQAGYSQGWEEKPTQQPGILSRIWSAINTGPSGKDLLNQAATGSLGYSSPAMGPGFVPPQPQGDVYGALKNEAAARYARGERMGLPGMITDTADTAAGMITPLTIATAGGGAATQLPGKLGTAAKVIMPLVSAGFAAKGGSDVIRAGAPKFSLEADAENTPEAWSQRLQGGALLAGGTAGVASVVTPSSPRSGLSRMVRPDNAVEFHAAEQTAIPRIKAASEARGQSLKTANDALDAIRQAKQDALLEAHDAAGPGRTILDLTGPELTTFTRDMNALDMLDEHIRDAQETAQQNAKTKQPTKAEAATQIAKGGAKIVAGKIAGSAVPGVGRYLLDLAGLGYGGRDVASGIRNLVSRVSLTPENLDSAVARTFQEGPPAREMPALSEPERPQPQPYIGDLTVPHTSTVGPPEVAGGDLTVTPVRPDRPALWRQAGTQPTTPPIPQPQNFIGPIQQREPLGPPVVARAAQASEAAQAQPLKATTPDKALAEVFKKMGIAAPGASTKPLASVPSARLTPRGDLSFPANHGESAALIQLTHSSINELRAIAVQRGLKVLPSDDSAALAGKIYDHLTPEEIKDFHDQVIERNRAGIRIPGWQERQTVNPPASDLTGVLERSIEQAKAKKPRAAKKTAAGE